MNFESLFIIVLTIECIFLACLFVLADKRWSASEQDRADAEKWRRGQRPIGKLTRVKHDEAGIWVEGQITDDEVWRKISGFTPGSLSLDPFTSEKEEK